MINGNTIWKIERLELYTGNRSTQHFYTYKSGIRVNIHNQSLVHYPGMISEVGFDVANSFQTNVKVQRTFQNHLPEPYSNCLDVLNSQTATNGLLQQLYLDFNLTRHSQKYCMKLCYQVLNNFNN